MTKNGGGQREKKGIYNEHVNFREFKDAFLENAAEFEEGKILQMSTVFTAKRDQTKFIDGRKKRPFV